MATQQMTTTDRLTSRLEQAISAWQNEQSGSYGNEAVAYMMRMPGKRFRPMLFLHGYELFNSDIESALAPALAIEVFHNFTLVHDDIMDKAELRRGKPTVHTVFGVNDAIIAGDMLLCHAYALLGKAPQQVLKPVLDVFSTAALEVMEGQQMDMEFEQRDEVSEEEYLLMIEKKTAVLLAAAVQMGALIGGADHRDAKHLYDFGKYLGLMFQIKDDLLDAFGTHRQVGKRVGGDIIQNKKTYLHISAMKLATPGTKNAIREAYSIDNDDVKVNTVKSLFEQVGARKQAEDKMNGYYQLAMRSLEKVRVEDDLKQTLRQLASSIHSREY